MREGVHDGIAKFRVNQGLLSAAEAKARREGMTFSEMMRAALRRELRDAALMADLLDQAARGCREAQSAMLDHAIASADLAHIRPIEALVAAETWARCAASHGELIDIRRLSSVLLMRAGYERQHGSVSLAASVDAEALTLLNICADEGDELAARALCEAADALPAAPFELLRKVRAAAVERGSEPA